VGRALSDDVEDVKERTIGVEVFGRDPDYDTSLDPVVRVTAAEVRKRLALYYKELGHEHELRIEIARGSYVPDFRFPAEDFSLGASAPLGTTSIDQQSRSQGAARLQWVLIVCLAVPYLIYSINYLRLTRPTALDHFWSPVLNSKFPALLCVPVEIAYLIPMQNPIESKSQSATPAPHLATPGRVSFGASLALSTLTGVLASRGKVYHIRQTEDAGLNDLKDGPVVLIGGFSNRWTMELGGGLRYTLAHDGSLEYVADERNPSSREWAASEPVSDGAPFADYAIVSRVHSPTTGRALITLAGLRQFGTQSAAECLADANCLQAAERLVPGDWNTANVQVVLKTTVIGGTAGQAEVQAAYLW
jgi:hypothetical protein